MLREHLEKLYPFSVVARLQSFRKASQALRVTQPALTRTVQALERDLGVELFKRHKQRIHITSEGERLLALASRLLHETEDAEGLLRSTGSALAGKLRLGTFESLSVRVLPKVMCQLARTYPQLSFSITSSGTEEIADALARGELDFGFCGRPKAPRVGLVFKPILRDHFSFYASLRVRERCPALERHSLAYVPDAEVGPSETLRDYLIASGITSQGTYEVNSFEAAREYVLAGAGLAVLPGLIACAAVKAGKIRAVHPKGVITARLGEHEIGVLVTARQASQPRSLLLETALTEALNGA